MSSGPGGGGPPGGEGGPPEGGGPPGGEGSAPCGDGVCDDFEQANPEICPADCEEVSPDP